MTVYLLGPPFLCTASASSSPSPRSRSYFYHGLCCIRRRLWIKRTCDADSFFLRFFLICCCCLRGCGIPDIPSRLCSCSDTLPEFVRVVCPHCVFGTPSLLLCLSLCSVIPTLSLKSIGVCGYHPMEYGIVSVELQLETFLSRLLFL